jgi:hypothetical protein
MLLLYHGSDRGACGAVPPDPKNRNHHEGAKGTKKKRRRRVPGIHSQKRRSEAFDIDVRPLSSFILRDLRVFVVQLTFRIPVCFRIAVRVRRGGMIDV